MHWVLIYWIVSVSGVYGARTTSTASAVFDDEAACRAGLSIIQKALDGRLSEPAAHGICVPQASDGAHR